MAGKNNSEAPPLQWGDRIDHKLFGLGTINGEPVGMVGGNSSGEIVDRGFRVPISWDDPDRKDGQFNSSGLKLVERPDARGGAYWNNEYKKLAAAVTKTRGHTDIAIGRSYRPVKNDGVQVIREALLEEQTAIADLLGFLSEDELGNHA